MHLILSVAVDIANTVLQVQLGGKNASKLNMALLTTVSKSVVLTTK